MKASNAGPGKGTLKKVVVVTAIVAAAALAAASAAWFIGGGPGGGRLGAGAGQAVDQRESVPAAGATQIIVSAVSEEVRLSVGPGDTVEARLHGRATIGDPAALPRLSAAMTEGRIEVRVDRQGTVGFNWSSLVLDLTIPADWVGGIDIGTVSGSVTLPALSVSTLAVHTVSGSADLAAIRGSSASFHTTSGRLRAEALDVDTVDLGSVSGALSVRRISGSVRARSTSGAVSLGFPPDAGFRLEARSVSGRVTCDFPVTLSGAGDGGARHVLAGTIGDGRDEVNVTTVSGSIALKR